MSVVTIIDVLSLRGGKKINGLLLNRSLDTRKDAAIEI